MLMLMMQHVGAAVFGLGAGALCPLPSLIECRPGQNAQSHRGVAIGMNSVFVRLYEPIPLTAGHGGDLRIRGNPDRGLLSDGILHLASRQVNVIKPVTFIASKGCGFTGNSLAAMELGPGPSGVCAAGVTGSPKTGSPGGGITSIVFTAGKVFAA